MIRYFNRNETSFNHNEAILNPISCYISEEANGLYELECEIARNIDIAEGGIIKTPSPRGEQLFRIYRIKKSLKGKKVYARHIFYDLSKNFIINVELNNVSGFTALQSILSNCETSHNFVGTSDILDQATITYSRINPVEAIIGKDNSILNLYGGNLIRNNFNINIKAIGTDRGYDIRLGKNLIGIDADVDESKVKTRIYPTVVLGDDDTVYSLPEKYVDSPLINNYGEPIISTVEIKLTDEQKVLPIEDIYIIMRDYCNSLFEINNIDKPIINYKVDFVELSKTEQYKDLAILEQLDLYDIVSVNVNHLDINVKARVIKYKYDCLKDRYDSIELGDFSLVSNYSTDGMVSQINNKIRANQTAVEYATNVITGNKGGHIVTRRYPNGKPYELLVMDTEDINTAVNVFRLNNSGLGFSQNGYNGVYGTAMTIDGHIVADYIDTGILTSILLKSDNYIKNVSGMQINLADGTIDSKNFKLYSTGDGFFNGTLGANAINANIINALDITAKSVSSDWVYTGNLSASQITAGTISGDRIYGGTIQGVTFSSYSLNNQQFTTISGGVITTNGIHLDSGIGNSGYITPEAIQLYKPGQGNVFYAYNDGSVGCISLSCSSINGGIPTHSGNLQSQFNSLGITVSSATYASFAGSAGSLDNKVYVSSNGNFRPSYDLMGSCGTDGATGGARWTSVWALNGMIQTSDERKKTKIKPLSEDNRFLRFARLIMPYTYQMIEGTSGRYHVGFIAQRVEEAMKECGISDMEFAGLIKTPIYAKKLIDDDGNELDEFDTTSDIIDYSYSLRYDEFIPLLLNMIHIQKDEINVIKSELQDIKQRLSNLD